MVKIPLPSAGAPYVWSLACDANSVPATIFAPGELRVTEEPTELFLDGFDTGLDTTNRWKAPTAAGGGVAASNVVSFTQLGTGTTANGYSYLESVFAFPPHNPGWLYVSMGNNLPFPYIANTYFFFGIGTSPATPTAAAPITEGAGFEVAVGGKMYAVMYQGGVRQQIADLSSSGNNTQPLDANVHYYHMYYKGSNTLWAIDSLDNIVAQTTTGAPGPNVNTLPLKITAIAGTSNPPSSGVITCNVAHVSDTTRNSFQISDGLFGWRKATVDTLGSLQVKQLLANGLAISTTNPVPVTDVGAGSVTLIQQSAAITAGSAGTCTLAGAVGKTTYIRGFSVTSDAVATIVSGLITLTGLTNTYNYRYADPAVGQGYLYQYFGEDGIPASATNTPIVVNFPALTGGGATAINVWGYQL